MCWMRMFFAFKMRIKDVWYVEWGRFACRMGEKMLVCCMQNGGKDVGVLHVEWGKRCWCFACRMRDADAWRVEWRYFAFKIRKKFGVSNEVDLLVCRMRNKDVWCVEWGCYHPHWGRSTSLACWMPILLCRIWKISMCLASWMII